MSRKSERNKEKAPPKPPYGAILLIPQSCCDSPEAADVGLLLRTPHVVVTISSKVVSHLMQALGETPAPWPLIPDVADDEIYDNQENVTFANWLDWPAHQAFLRQLSYGGGYGRPAVFINPLSAYAAVESSLRELLSSGSFLSPPTDLLRVVNALGWCGIGCGREGLDWAFFFRNDKAAQKEAFEARLRHAGIEWWYFHDRTAYRDGVWLVPST